MSDEVPSGRIYSNPGLSIIRGDYPSCELFGNDPFISRQAHLLGPAKKIDEVFVFAPFYKEEMIGFARRKSKRRTENETEN